MHDEYNKDFTWVDLDTIVAYDISYIDRLDNCFIEFGGTCSDKQILFENNSSICTVRNRYIQGNMWKLDIDLYNRLMETFKDIQKRGLKLRYDLQDLFSYYIYIKKKGELENINILGNNVMQSAIYGLSIWGMNYDARPSIEGLEQMYYDDNILRSKVCSEKEIHIVSFVFTELKKVINNEKFRELFGN